MTIGKLTYQNQSGALNEVRHFSCYCDSLYNYKALKQGIDTSIQELNNYWTTAKANGIIDNNPNSKTYLEILKPQALVDLMKLPLQYIDGHFAPDSIIPDDVYTIGAYYNKRTNFLHFVVIDPKTKKIIFDPIYGGSITAKEGVLQSIRYYKEIV